MKKKHIVRLSKDERRILEEVIKKSKGKPQRIRRAQILLKADAEGPNWTDQKISEEFLCRRQTVENIRDSLMTNGFEVALNGKKRKGSPRKKVFTEEQEAKLIAMHQSPPPDGFSNWSLRLLAEKAMEFGFVESISHETVRQTLKKRYDMEFQKG